MYHEPGAYLVIAVDPADDGGAPDAALEHNALKLRSFMSFRWDDLIHLDDYDTYFMIRIDTDSVEVTAGASLPSYVKDMAVFQIHHVFETFVEETTEEFPWGHVCTCWVHVADAPPAVLQVQKGREFQAPWEYAVVQPLGALPPLRAPPCGGLSVAEGLERKVVRRQAEPPPKFRCVHDLLDLLHYIGADATLVTDALQRCSLI